MESMRAQKSVTGVFSMCHVCMLSCAALISEVVFRKWNALWYCIVVVLSSFCTYIFKLEFKNSSNL